MRMTAIAVVLLLGTLQAQEPKPVPKDSVRLSIPGCSKGYVFTAGPRTPDQPGSASVPEGTHLRMNGPKKLISDIKAHEGSMIEITGLVKKGDLVPDGVAIGGVRIRPGRGPTSSVSGTPLGGHISIDVEGWRLAVGSCRTR
jgi:hypothetical protein